MTFISYPLASAARPQASGTALAFIQTLWSTATTSAPDLHIEKPQINDIFVEYAAYDANWDGSGAEAITPETVQAARSFNRMLPRNLPPPDIAPGADGTIGFEWREGPRETRKFVMWR